MLWKCVSYLYPRQIHESAARTHHFDEEAAKTAYSHCVNLSAGHEQKLNKAEIAILFATSSPHSPRFCSMQIWQLDLVNFQWNQVACKGTLPPFRVHCSSAVVENRWILHGGRIPAPSSQFNVQNQSYVLNLNTWR